MWKVLLNFYASYVVFAQVMTLLLHKIKKSCKNITKSNDEIDYSFEIKNTGNVELEDFTWYDYLPADYAKITGIETGTYNKDILYNIYYKTNQYGSRVDSEGKSVANSNPNAVTVNYIDLSKESFGTENGKEATQVATEHLSLILAGGNKWKNQYRNNQEMLNLLDEKKYGNQLMDTEYPNGFYAYLNGKKFVENLGEYYQGSSQDEDESLASTTATKIKKRVITYKLTN